MNPEKPLVQYIGQEVIDHAGELADQFRSARPFRHVRIDDFFSPELVRDLSGNFPPFDERLAVNEDGVVGNKAVHEKIMDLGPAWETLDSLVRCKEFLGLVSRITGIPDLRYDPHYFGGGTHENRHGQGLDAHIDFNFHPVTRQHRRLNLIVYLNEEWLDEWGGAIELHKDPYLPEDQDEVVSISPQYNRCVIFETNEHSWHGFSKVNLPADRRSLSRRSFALYYYTETRPEDETGLEHSTIYVDQRLPQTYQEGLQLQENHVHQLQQLLGHRDQHIRRLYENVKQSTAEANKLRAQWKLHEEQQRELEFLRSEFHRQKQEIKQFSEDQTRLCAEVEEKSVRISNLQEQVQEFRDSTSWRITRPLRKLKTLLDEKRKSN